MNRGENYGREFDEEFERMRALHEEDKKNRPPVFVPTLVQIAATRGQSNQAILFGLDEHGRAWEYDEDMAEWAALPCTEDGS